MVEDFIVIYSRINNRNALTELRHGYEEKGKKILAAQAALASRTAILQSHSQNDEK
jgi:hypothetical protein